MGIRTARNQNFRYIIFFKHICGIIFSAGQERPGHADIIADDESGTSTARIQEQSPFPDTEGNRHVDKHRTGRFFIATAADVARVGIDPCRDIDGNDLKAARCCHFVDHIDHAAHGHAQRTMESCSQYSIDHNLAGCQSPVQCIPGLVRRYKVIYKAGFLIGQFLQGMEMSLCFRTVRFFCSQHIDIDPGATVQKMTGYDKTVSPVIALAAQNHDVLTLPAMDGLFCAGNDGVTGIFHEDCRRNGIPAMHGRLIHAPHLGCCIELLHDTLLIDYKYKAGSTASPLTRISK